MTSTAASKADPGLKSGPGVMAGNAGPGMLAGLRVIEVADELGEYCGLLLAGLGAEVIKVEPPQGSPTRGIGPFLDDIENPEKSVFFWNYNRGKRSILIDPEQPEGRDELLVLIESADILLDTSCGALNRQIGLDRDALLERFPALIVARMTPFGDVGPWKDFKASDLIHLALGGEMKNCGYDTHPSGHYDLPPIAPQLWHAYHIAGDQLAVGIVAAVLHRESAGVGQDVSCAIHEAVAKNTELDVMNWVMRRAPLYRQTSRHAAEHKSFVPPIAHTKDGRWFIAWGVGARDRAKLVPFLEKYGMQGDLKPPGADADFNARSVPGASVADEETVHVLEVIQRFVRAFRYDDMPWAEAQAAGLLWSPLRKPHENALDEHWLKRHSFADVPHPELGRPLRYATSRWLATGTSWQVGQRAPLIGEHSAAIRAELSDHQPMRVEAQPRNTKPVLSPHGKPFPLQGVRILDFSWFLASAGGTRFMAALGAESIKVEWKENPDTRLAAMAPVGGRDARRAATAPLPGVRDLNMGGQFNNKNSGKRGMSLNIRHPRGLEIAKELVRQSDIVAEGFLPRRAGTARSGL